MEGHGRRHMTAAEPERWPPAPRDGARHGPAPSGRAAPASSSRAAPHGARRGHLGASWGLPSGLDFLARQSSKGRARTSKAASSTVSCQNRLLFLLQLTNVPVSPPPSPQACWLWFRVPPVNHSPKISRGKVQNSTPHAFKWPPSRAAGRTLASPAARRRRREAGSAKREALPRAEPREAGAGRPGRRRPRAPGGLQRSRGSWHVLPADQGGACPPHTIRSSVPQIFIVPATVLGIRVTTMNKACGLTELKSGGREKQ